MLGEGIVSALSNQSILSDVGSSHPGGAVPSKGPSVRRLKGHASWVQNVVRQFGLYPVESWSV